MDHEPLLGGNYSNWGQTICKLYHTVLVSGSYKQALLSSQIQGSKGPSRSYKYYKFMFFEVTHRQPHKTWPEHAPGKVCGHTDL